jgi:hypothetical protein
VCALSCIFLCVGKVCVIDALIVWVFGGSCGTPFIGRRAYLRFSLTDQLRQRRLKTRFNQQRGKTIE